MEITVENIIYQLDTDNKTAVVIDYQNNPVDVIIPEYVEFENKKYKVTSIGYDAFYRCTSLTSITIPNSVTYIGDRAFYDCCRLTSIDIPNSVTSIRYKSFAHCSSLSSITIPNNVTKIGDWAFCECRSLTSITIPNSVTYIGNGAFYGCSSLTSITIPNSVTSIGDYAFNKCQSLQSITIPNSVTSIGDYAFNKCQSLQSINIPNSVTKIGIGVFDNIGLTLPKKYTEDGKLIGYKGFNADMTCRDFQYEEGKTFEFEGEIKLCNCGFHACTNLLDLFNYYWGAINKDIFIHEVYLSGDIDEDNRCDSKVCTSKIEIGRRLTMKDINEIINNK